MSRLRARTWTQRERRIMWIWKLWYGVTSGHNERDLTWVDNYVGGHLPQLAERIMREKGHKRPAGRWHHVRGKWRHKMAREDREYRSHYANRKYPTKGQPDIDPFLDGELSQRWMRWAYPDYIWVPSDFNPNILVRKNP